MTNFESTLQTIVEWLTSRGYTVNTHSNQNSYIRSESTINCFGKAHGTNIYLTSLLHEAGHAIQPDSIFTTLPKTKASMLAIILSQEYSAWLLGYQLGLDLNILHDELLDLYITEWCRHWTDYCREVSKYSKKQLGSIYLGYVDSPGLYKPPRLK